MKTFFNNAFYSLPVQLFILHFRKYQVLLFFWYILFSTTGSSFMKYFGADALFFSPEYLGKVNMLGCFITGVALGVFIMSWNITTFILHSRRLKFLATTTNPFLKYCINNAVVPLFFLIFYFNRLYNFNHYKELMPAIQIFYQLFGIMLGIILIILISFAYFFGAQKTIMRTMAPVLTTPGLFNKTFKGNMFKDEYGLKVKYYFDSFLRIKKARNVAHYRQDFLDTIFKRYHLAAIFCILLAFSCIVTVGFLLDHKIFEIPAAASILIVFALLIALIGSLTYFLQSWSLPAVILIFIAINFLYKAGIIDPRNKAYGLNYLKNVERPAYNKQSLLALSSPQKIEIDKINMLSVLDKWKLKQHTEKPLMVFINVSGGGLRSTAFTMNALQQADSICGGELFKKTFLISGASGGMLAATYYRELYRKKKIDNRINLYDSKYTDNISGDLLNPVFTSLMARDIFAPVQKFAIGENKYLKDRGYAFEKKLNENAHGLLNIQMKDLAVDEHEANIPLMIFNSVIKTDARKLIISTQPLSFMMKPVQAQNDTAVSPDAVDFAALFHNLRPMDLRVLTALRMNATFPYVLPNVWLPSDPVIDVMDAGLRDNYGRETSLRFIDNFKEWIAANTGGVIILQIRDRFNDNWQQPFETNSVTDMFLTPATMLQHNWFKMQDYYQTDQMEYFKNTAGLKIYNAAIMYMPAVEEKTAALNFHLSQREKRDVILSFKNETNTKAIKGIAELLGRK
jgi:hypothetical protein